MSNHQDPTRHAKGTPAGGRFAAQQRGEAVGVDLAERPATSFEAEVDALRERRRAEREARYASMADTFRRSGANVTKVVGARGGYCAVTVERGDALSTVQVMLGSFAGDPESGCPTISSEQVSRPADKWDRDRTEEWETTMTTDPQGSSSLDPPQRVARTEAIQYAWEAAESCRTKGWVERLDIAIDRPEPDSFRTVVRIDGREVADRTWEAQR